MIIDEMKYLKSLPKKVSDEYRRLKSLAIREGVNNNRVTEKNGEYFFIKNGDNDEILMGTTEKYNELQQS